MLIKLFEEFSDKQFTRVDSSKITELESSEIIPFTSNELEKLSELGTIINYSENVVYDLYDNIIDKNNYDIIFLRVDPKRKGFSIFLGLYKISDD